MPLAAYLPLELVYAFHEPAETWIWRRYAGGVVEGPAGERVRPTFSENPIAIFRDRTAKGTQQKDAGQAAPQTCTVYTRTRLFTTQDAAQSVQACDVLFDPSDGSAWQATTSGDWDEARGFAVTLTKIGAVGGPPWA